MYRKIKNVFTLVLGIIVFGLFQSVSADWNVNSGGGVSAGGPQDIMISLKSNPMSNPEMACLAVTFARSLSAGPNNNVTLFVTLDGVSLADASVTGSRRFKCEIPDGFPEDETIISLEDNLIAFLTKNGMTDINNDKMVVCPICWKSRYGEESPDYGTNNGMAIGPMILNADKILDF